MRLRHIFFFSLLVLTIGLASPSLWAQTPAINVQFSSGATFSGAAVIGSGGDTWNKMTTTSGGPTTLNNVSGASTGVTVSWTSTALIVGAGGGFAATIYTNLMNDYLYTSSSNSITFAGLSASQAYTVYVYTQGDSASAGRELTVTPGIGSAATSTATVAAQNSFVSNQNYLIVTATTDGSGNLALTYSKAVGEGDLNAIQLVGPVPSHTVATPALRPESMIILILLISGAGYICLRRMRQDPAI